VQEIRRGRMGEAIEGLLERGVLVVKQPSSASLNRVRESASLTGDLDRLSNADKELLALAYDLGASVLSDDYSIQNLARVLGIECMAFGKKPISKTLTWRYRCKGCGRFYDNMQKDCRICGSQVVLKRYKEKTDR
jgi:endoribonuclease Nob1